MHRLIKTTALAATAAALAFVGGSQAQQPPPQFPDMTFFITSVGGPQGANYGGLEGADRHCQTLATKAGAGSKTWRAYLSTQAVGGATAVNAKDRIGKGPWTNAKGVVDRHQRRGPALGQQQAYGGCECRRDGPPDPEPSLHGQPA